jgi:hypothetical protein
MQNRHDEAVGKAPPVPPRGMGANMRLHSLRRHNVATTPNKVPMADEHVPDTAGDVPGAQTLVDWTEPLLHNVESTGERQTTRREQTQRHCGNRRMHNVH